MSEFTASRTQTKQTTLVGTLRQRADQHPNQRAFTFLTDSETDEQTITYAQLDQQARAIAAWLQEMDAVGQRALLLYPSGLDFIAALFGCFYAGVVAVPTYPARMERSSQRLQSIVRDAQPTVVLTDTASQSEVEQHFISGFAQLEWLATDNLASSLATEWQDLGLTADSLAFLQYTSGSTAISKGVMLTHGNLLHNLAAIESSFRLSAVQSGVSWLPLYHDMGLIGGVLLPIYGSGHNTLMSPLSFLHKPLRWLQAIDRMSATVSGGPNFAYDLCVERITPEEAATLDLSRWLVAFNGAEPIRSQTLERFATAFAASGFQRQAFYPVYGLAEATLFVSGTVRQTPSNNEHRGFPTSSLSDGGIDMPFHRNHNGHGPNGNHRNAYRHVDVFSDPSTKQLPVSCGQSWQGQTIRIVEAESQILCQDGQVGEIWVAGPHVAQGYWNRPAETRETFRASLVDNSDVHFLRTGDLGFLHDGELFITGRLKDLIIIRGQNHYPQDIEFAAEESHPALRSNCGAAFSVSPEPDGAEQLVIVYELRPTTLDTDVDEIATAIRSSVVQTHDLEVHTIVLIEPNSLPKTTSGKVQRHRCQELFLQKKLAVIAQSIRSNNDLASEPQPQAGDELAPLEIALRTKLAELLNVPPAEIDFSQPIHSLGLGSLAAAALKSHVESNYDVELPVALFFEDVSIYELIPRLLATPSQDEQGQAHGEQSTDRQQVPQSEQITSAVHGNGLPHRATQTMEFSLLFFSANEAEFEQDKYRLLLEAAQFADEHDFNAVWLPERHFHAFGGLYPDPAVLAAALATTTKRIRLRAGSIVLPLNNPVRVAEQWAVVDNLSNGRVDLSFAAGWNPNDFVLAPDAFDDRIERTHTGMQTVQRLWQGESVVLPNGAGEEREVRIYPLPQQKSLNMWLTCSGGPQRFIEAGAAGVNVLTALLFQPIEELGEKIALYRKARAEHGHDPEAGHVTLMLHTYLGESMDEVRRIVREPLTHYLETSANLWQQAAKPPEELSDNERQDALDYAFERYVQTSTLMGTPQRCMTMVEQLQEVGVDEIACLVDFGAAREDVLGSLGLLSTLTDKQSS
ncbi:MAG: MupA/Atu3671 family FMN-dependent luciferase-like monooxygenase [Chloroflexota bacterium]